MASYKVCEHGADQFFDFVGWDLEDAIQGLLAEIESSESEIETFEKEKRQDENE